MLQAEYLRRPDSRSATVDWFLENVPSGTHIAVEYDAVEFLVNAGPPRSKVFFVEVINPIRKGSLEGLVGRGFEFAVADSRSENGLFHINRGEQKALPAKLEPVLELLNEDGHQGPDRYIFRLPQVIKNPMHIFFGEPTPGLLAFNRHQLLPPVIFRGFDLGTNTVSNDESLDLALYWDAQRQLALIAKSSKHENAKQPHWAQARSSCWGTRSPPTIGDSARCMQNLEKVLFTGPKTSDTVTFICD